MYIYWVYQGVLGGSSGEEPHRSETVSPKRATPIGTLAYYEHGGLAVSGLPLPKMHRT